MNLSLRGLVIAIVVVFSMPFILAGCADNTLTPGGAGPGSNFHKRGHYSDDQALLTEELTDRVNEFGIHLFKEIVERRPDENVLLSPLSISVALGMAANGAAGETRQEMLRALQMENWNMEIVNATYRQILKQLRTSSPTTVWLANSIWCRRGEKFKDSFLEACEYHFGGEVRTLDFCARGASDIINRWVAEKTDSKIVRLVGEDIDCNTFMVLINALAFEGTWKYEFNRESTSIDFFELPDGHRVLCKMMQRPGLPLYPDTLRCEFTYWFHELFQAVELPYADSLFSMIVILPHEWVGIDDLISAFDIELWKLFADRRCRSHGILRLPKFEMTFDGERSLMDALEALGMKKAFDPQAADFSSMSDNDELFIKKIKHLTYLNVEEKGTQASAATAVDVRIICSMCPPRFEMNVNRPFIVCIVDNSTGAILFLGKVVDPRT